MGDFVELFVIDTRTNRDQPVPPPTMNEEWRTALGPAQRDWLFRSLDESKAHWRLIGNASVMGQTWTETLPDDVREPMALLKLLGEGGVGADPDQWDGYPVERAELIKVMDKGETGNIVVLSGDVHVAIVLELHEDSFSGSDPAAVEFVTASITSMNLDDKMHWPRSSEQSDEIARNTAATLPHWKWCEFDSNGYMVVDVTRERVLGEWWFLDTVLEPSTNEELAASWMVEHGRPVAVPVPTE
jgi:alkaline phosphatase D